MANIEKVLNVLDKVKPQGNNKWLACCPAHDDRSPSLGIALKEEKILFKCWSGCGGMDVAQAVIDKGCEWDDLFPDKLENTKSFFPKPKATTSEKDIILLMAKDKRSRGERLTTSEKQAEMNAYLASKRAG